MDWTEWGPPLAVVLASLAMGGVLATRMRTSQAEAAEVEASGRQDDLALDKDEVLEALAALEGDREAMPAEEYDRQRQELIERGAAALRALDALEPASAPDASVIDAAFAEVQAARAEGRDPDPQAVKLVREAVGGTSATSTAAAQARGFAYAVGMLVVVGVLLFLVSQIDATPRGAGGSMTGNGAGDGGEAMGAAPAAPALPPAMQAEQARHLETLESSPDDVDALNGLTRIALASGDVGGALRYNQLAEGVAPDNAMVRVFKGVMASAIGRRERAYELIDGVIAEQPELVDAHIYKGLVALSARDSAVAVEALEQAVALQDPPDPNLEQALLRARAMKEMGITPQTQMPSAAASPAPAASGGEVLVSGTLELPQELAGAVPISQATFVYLRVPGRPGPPVASVKLPPGPFPLAFTITTANVLPMAGVAPDELPDTLELGARLDQDGNAFSKLDEEPQGTLEATRGETEVVLPLAAELHP